MVEEEMTRFRALAARANYLAADRPDAQFAAKEVCRDMAAPSAASWARLKKLVRFLLDTPRLVWNMGGSQQEWEVLEVYSD